MDINVEEEIRHFISKCKPRINGVLSDGYGIHILRENLLQFNEYNLALRENASETQLQYQSLYGFSMTIAEFEYAMGYPVQRIRYFLERASWYMMKCVELRGTNSSFEFTTSLQNAHEKWTETVEDAQSYVDDSLGNALKGFYAGLTAELAGNEQLMQNIFSKITFSDYDYEVQGNADTTALRALVLLGSNDATGARNILSSISTDSVMERIANGILNRNNYMFEDGLKTVFLNAEKAGQSLFEDNKVYFLRKGLEPAPGKYWCIEGMGLISFARRNGLKCNFSHKYIFHELFEKRS